MRAEAATSAAPVAIHTRWYNVRANSVNASSPSKDGGQLTIFTSGTCNVPDYKLQLFRFRLRARPKLDTETVRINRGALYIVQDLDDRLQAMALPRSLGFGNPSAAGRMQAGALEA